MKPLDDPDTRARHLAAVERMDRAVARNDRVKLAMDRLGDELAAAVLQLPATATPASQLAEGLASLRFFERMTAILQEAQAAHAESADAAFEARLLRREVGELS